MTRSLKLDPVVEEQRQLCKDDLLFFVAEILGYGRARDPSRPHLKIDVSEGSPHWNFARFIENQAKKASSEVVESLCLMPRGYLKTTIGTIGASIWLLARNPEAAILIYASTADKAALFLSEIKDHLKGNERLLALFPELGPHREGPWQVDRIRIDGRTLPRKEASITAVGLIQGKAGGHYDVIINDDLHDESNAGTAEQCQKVVDAYQRERPLLPDQLHGWIHTTGTRWHGADAYGHMIERNSIAKEKGKNEPVAMISMRLEEDGTPTWPSVYDERAIKSLKESMDPEVFFSQYMNDPFTESQQIFKKSDIEKAYVTRDDLPVDGGLYFSAVDPGYNTNKWNDFSAIVTWVIHKAPGAIHGYLVTVVDVFRERVEPSRLIEEIFRTNETWKPVTISVEANSSQLVMKHAIYEAAKNRGAIPWRAMERGGGHSALKGKSRIRRLEPYLRNGTLRLVRGARGIEALVRELQDYPRGSHDDAIDALADFPEISFAPSVVSSMSRWKSLEETATTWDQYRKMHDEEPLYDGVPVGIVVRPQ